MTQPKRHIAGQTAFMTRRTFHGTYFLRPGEDTRELAGYLFARAARSTGLKVHGAMMMSNHGHNVSTDPNAARSKFMQRFHSQMGIKRNLQLGREDSLWDCKEAGDMALLDLKKIIDKLIYTFTQPVKDGCVDRVEEWTGFMILPRHWGKEMKFRRPDVVGDSLPEYETLTPQPPPGFEHLPLEDVIAFFEDLIRKEEDRLRSLREGPPMGIEACEAMDPFFVPTKKRPRSTLNPRYSGSDATRLRVALNHYFAWRRVHRRMRQLLAEGHQDVVFPAGTKQMARLAHVKVAAVEPGDPHLPDLDWPTELIEEWLQFVEGQLEHSIDMAS